jgi:hypothetical protein
MVSYFANLCCAGGNRNNRIINLPVNNNQNRGGTPSVALEVIALISCCVFCLALGSICGDRTDRNNRQNNQNVELDEHINADPTQIHM